MKYVSIFILSFAGSKPEMQGPHKSSVFAGGTSKIQGPCKNSGRDMKMQGLAALLILGETLQK